jgi:hypothetical protein
MTFQTVNERMMNDAYISLDRNIHHGGSAVHLDLSRTIALGWATRRTAVNRVRSDIAGNTEAKIRIV